MRGEKAVAASINLSQRRFLYDDRDADAARDDDGERWAVPVNLRASVGGVVQRQRLLVDGATASVNFDGPVDWVVVNDGAWGYYRVNYSPDLLGRLTAPGLPALGNPLDPAGDCGQSLLVMGPGI